MELLFPELEPEVAAAAVRVGVFAQVALESGIDHVLDYSVPGRLVSQVKVGQRVKVPLGRGNKVSSGYVVALLEESAVPRIKPMAALEDPRVLVSPQLMQLARWMSRYYVTPLGVVLDSVIPSAVKRRIGVGYSTIVRASLDAPALQDVLEKTRAPKRRAILARLLQLEPGTGIELVRLAGEAGVTAPTVRKLARLGVVQLSQEMDLTPAEALTVTPALQPAMVLNAEQQAVFDELRPRVAGGGFSVNLLHGVTGSGKTEVYLQCIAEAVSRGRQAIVLVPEIALTPQTVRRFTARFPRVAVLHSGLTASERNRHWQRLSNGEADVAVGARSAVFAPVPNLGILVVDEEHEASYKQDTAPRYQARDVAIKRAQLEGVPVLLGSATPSLESYQRVLSATALAPSPGTPGEGRGEGDAERRTSPDAPNHLHRADRRSLPEYRERGPEQSIYHLLSMPTRVRNLQMPHVEVIDLHQEKRFRRGVHLISQRLEHLLRTTLEAGHQAILMLNRRGYSNFVFCASCNSAIPCKYCDATMTYHRSAATDVHSAKLEAGLHTGQLHCHYCLAVNTLPQKCPTCGKKLSLFGLGTQRVEEELTRKFPDLRFARVDSDSMRSGKDYETLLGKFAKGELQVLLGTQMIAKGLDYPNVTLVGVISGDTALALPDFRAGERTFQLITQVAGRAGRGDAPGRVVLQTFLPDDPAIRFAIKQDFVGFARSELKHRAEVQLPPLARMVRIVLRDQDQEKLHTLSESLAAVVNQAVADTQAPVRVKGPMPCAISRIAGFFRNQIVLMADTPVPLQRVLAAVRETKSLRKNDRIAIDVDPVSLL